MTSKRTVGLFGRTYGMMLLAVILAETLIFTFLFASAPVVPPVVPFDSAVHQLVSGVGDPRLRLIETISASSPLGASPPGPADTLAGAVRHAIGDSGRDVRAYVDRFGPPSVFGVQSEDAVARGERPILVMGDFTISVHRADGRWHTISTDGRFLQAVRRRLALLLLTTLIMVAPFAYWMARKATLPIRRFADAADRLGRDPRAPPLRVVGPPELKLAGDAFNRMQERLTSYVEERTTMIAAVAHDIRTPLMRMAFLVEDAPPDLRLRIEQQIAEMRRLVEAVLRFLRDEGSRHLRERIDLASIVQAAVEDARHSRREVECVDTGEPLIIHGDPTGLRSVFANLIDNAVTYGDRARVVTRRRADSVVVEVYDEGPGIPEDDLARVFEPFFRLERSRNRATGGAGLGLAIVKSIVVAHGGSVRLSNRTPRGICATVELPI